MAISEFDALFFDLEFIAKTTGIQFNTVEQATDAYITRDVTAKWEPSALFCRCYYLQMYPDVLCSDIDPLIHYITTGIHEGRCAHPLFDHHHVCRQTNLAPASPMECYLRFLFGDLDVSPHPLVDLPFIRKQLGKELPANSIFRCIANADDALQFQPHPLFKHEYYKLQHDGGMPNALMDYLLNRPVEGMVHPLFSAGYYLAAQQYDRPTGAALVHYLNHWSRWSGNPSLFVDLQFANHDRTSIGTPFDALLDPLLTAVTADPSRVQHRLHPHVDPRIVAFSFANLVEAAPHLASAEQLALIIQKVTEAPAARVAGPGKKLISVVILNYHKPVYTALSVLAALNALAGLAVEILVIENGGEPAHHLELRRLFAQRPEVTFYKLDKNRYFGEANNIGIDWAQGEFVLFLNNDCFLHHSYGEEVAAMIKDGTAAGATGTLMLYPDGLVQEFGGIVSDCGQIIQRMKMMRASLLDGRDEPEKVDYASAACLLVSRQALAQAVGFDPAFEPFYYEDTDFCRRLTQARVPIRVSTRLRAMHIENASTKEYLGAGWDSLVGRNKEFFARRWLMPDRHSALIVDTSLPAKPVGGSAAPIRPIALVYTPFAIGLGGGERYLFSAARSLAKTHDVVICTDTIVSLARVRFACHALGIAPFACRVATFSEVVSWRDRPDITFVMGNEIIPSIPAIGRINLYHLQFPFPWLNIGVLDFDRIKRFDAIVVNSDFTVEWTRRRLAEAGVRSAPDVIKIFPAVRRPARPRRATGGVIRVVTVGRFFVGGHSKRQDVFLDILQQVRSFHGCPVEGVIIGSIHESEDARDYYASVARKADAMGGIRLIREASRGELEQELAEADIYLHCAGHDVAVAGKPHCVEHFGISLVEAIAAGCYPLAYRAGGPIEIIARAGVGKTYASITEAAALIASLNVKRDLLKFRPPAWLDETSQSRFDQRLADLIAAIAAPVTATVSNGTNGHARHSEVIFAAKAKPIRQTGRRQHAGSNGSV
jgi:GT2 family glycosyltransferase/glycosyltransferase involved in cell wall biosynthesis